MRSSTKPVSMQPRRIALFAAVTLSVVTFSGTDATAQAIADTTAATQCITRPASCAPQSVSMIQLIANPDRFDGKRVKVIGFVHFAIEESAVYLHREDFERNLLFNRLGADLGAEVAKGHAAINNQYVLLEGTFRADGGGMSSGALVDITSADVWPSHADTERQWRKGFKVLVRKPPHSSRPQ